VGGVGTAAATGSVLSETKMPPRARAPSMQRRVAAPTAAALRPQSTPRQPASQMHAPG